MEIENLVYFCEHEAEQTWPRSVWGSSLTLLITKRLPESFPFRMSGCHRTQQSPFAWNSGSASCRLQRGSTACCPPACAHCPRAAPGSVAGASSSRVGWDCPGVPLLRSPGRPGTSPCRWAPRRCRSCSHCRSPPSLNACAASGTSHASETGWCSWGPASPSLCSPSRWRAGGTTPASGGVGIDGSNGDVEGVVAGGDCGLSATLLLLLLPSVPADAPCSSWTSRASCGWQHPSAEPLSHPAAAAGENSSCTSSLRAFSRLSCCCGSSSPLLSFTSSSPHGVPHNNKERGWFLCFLSDSDHKWPSSPLKVYLFTIISSFFLPFGFSWCIARSSSPCSSSLPVRLAPLSRPLLVFFNLLFLPLWKSNQLLTVLMSELQWAAEQFKSVVLEV